MTSDCGGPLYRSAHGLVGYHIIVLALFGIVVGKNGQVTVPDDLADDFMDPVINHLLDGCIVERESGIARANGAGSADIALQLLTSAAGLRQLRDRR